ncbi:MAG: hypothetical protein IKT52_03275 [Oscillospiraceae bacterium]|nr:hypothetical protein [Oscillospiraceae bacterium]
MKEFRLSTPAERIAGVCFSVATIAALAVLLYALRANTTLLVFCGLCSVFVAVLLICYIRGIMRAVAYVDAEKKTVRVLGMIDKTVDVSEATMLQTFARKSGQSTVRMLVFSDKNDDILFMLPTMFTFRQGIWADPMAKEMAEVLGISFKQTVPDWEFDKEKYKEHVKEEEERQKREAKERRKKRTELRIQKIKNRK